MGNDPRAGHVPDVAFTALRTERLLLRRFRREDAASLAAYRSDPDVARYQSWDTPFTLEQAHRFIQDLADSHPDTPGEWFQFAVVEAATGVHIGDVAAGVDADDPRLATIGVTLATSAQGRGYAGEAVAWLLDYLFVDRQKHRVTADCDVRTAAPSHFSIISGCGARHIMCRAVGGRGSGSTSTCTPSSPESGWRDGRRAEASGASTSARRGELCRCREPSDSR